MVDTYAVAGGPLAVEGLFLRRCYFFQTVAGDVCLRQVKLRAVKFALRQVMFAFGESIPPAKFRTKELLNDAPQNIPPPCRGRGTTKWWKGCSGEDVTFSKPLSVMFACGK